MTDLLEHIEELFSTRVEVFEEQLRIMRNVEVAQPYERRCPVCGREVISQYWAKRYCSKKCTYAANNAKRRPLKTTKWAEYGRKAHVKKPDLRGVYLRKPDGTRQPVLSLARVHPG